MYFFLFFYGCHYTLRLIFLERRIEASISLTDVDRDSYDSTEIITEWEKTFQERTQAYETLLRTKKNSETSYDIILENFPCLSQSLIITLVSYIKIYKKII